MLTSIASDAKHPGFWHGGGSREWKVVRRTSIPARDLSFISEATTPGRRGIPELLGRRPSDRSFTVLRLGPLTRRLTRSGASTSGGSNSRFNLIPGFEVQTSPMCSIGRKPFRE